MKHLKILFWLYNKDQDTYEKVPFRGQYDIKLQSEVSSLISIMQSKDIFLYVGMKIVVTHPDTQQRHEFRIKDTWIEKLGGDELLLTVTLKL